MTGFNHGMTGAAIALTVKVPALALPLALASHFAIDSIPHFGIDESQLFGRRFNRILVGDFLFALLTMAVLAVLFPGKIWLIWSCMVVAAAPDLMWGYYHYHERIRKIVKKHGRVAKFHHWIQWSQTIKGAYIELLWFVFMGGVIFLIKLQ